jgi:predicted GNAT family acetyltransferase
MAEAADPEHTPAVELRDDPEEDRYELLLDGQLRGYVDYRVHGQKISILHTEVDRALDGRGYGSRLARYALDDARTRGLRVLVHCPFVRTYVRRHPEYEDLLTR